MVIRWAIRWAIRWVIRVVTIYLLAANVPLLESPCLFGKQNGKRPGWSLKNWNGWQWWFRSKSWNFRHEIKSFVTMIEIFFVLGIEDEDDKTLKGKFCQNFFWSCKKIRFWTRLEKFSFVAEFKNFVFQMVRRISTGKCTLVKIAEKNKLGHDTVFSRVIISL